MEDQLSCVATKHEADHSMSACEPRDEREDGGGVRGGEEEPTSDDHVGSTLG